MSSTPRFYERFGIGNTRYSVSFHDGVKTHKDGSPFYDIRLFSNKITKNKFVRELEQRGFRERRSEEL